MANAPRLAGRTALVTGGGQGVGRGIALALAADGAAVAVSGRTEDTLRTVVDEIAARGGRALAVTGDVGNPADVTRMVAETVRAFGGLGILVNNAQSSVQRTLAETTAEDVELAYRSGPLATLAAMRAGLPHLREHGGSIVNLGSSAALNGQRGFGSYAMAKEAIRGLSRVAATEWGPYGIRVNTVCPLSLTPAAAAYLESRPAEHTKLLADIPLGRMGDPERDIGRAVAALVSDDMSYLTGATLVFEGGRTLFA